jgi:hypothetical protein
VLVEMSEMSAADCSRGAVAVKEVAKKGVT